MNDYQITLNNQGQLEEFANDIKDAIVEGLRASEKFSSIRLRNARLHYNDFMNGRYRGLAYDTGEMVVRQTESALQLAGTVIHECAHLLVGVASQHNEDWRDAATHLGLVNVERCIMTYGPEHFTPAMLTRIEATLRRLRDKYPDLIYDDNIEIPWPPGKEPMPFQIENVRRMLRDHRGKNTLLADEMGLGKTVSVMGFINAALRADSRILVVCPNNIKLVWLRHFQEWCIHPYDVEVASSQLYTFSDVVIMNYEATVKWGPSLAKQPWDLVVFDEMHYLKTPSTKRAKMCYKIHAKKAIGVTGSPIVNYPDEAFPLLHYLDRPTWPEFEGFKHEYIVSGSRFGRNLNRLNARLRATIMLRSLKKDVLTQLPRKRRQVIEFEVPDEVKSLIQKEIDLWNTMQGNDGYDTLKLVNALRNESDVAGDDVDWEALILALQTTKKYAFEEMARIAHEIGRAKIPFVIEHITDILENREKCAVFGHHRDVLTKVAEAFPGSALILGGNTDQARANSEAEEKFANDENCRVFVGGIHAAQGYSLRTGSTVVFIEEDWVPGLMTQAEDRMHGIGRGDHEAKSLLVHHLVFADSLDTVKAKKAIKKQQGIERALNGRRD